MIGPRNLAIIPARSGSKRLPGKNVKLLHGRPLIGWTIDAANESGVFDTVIVSTDSEELAETARQLGADVPFLRPAGLSVDDSSPVDAAIDAIGRLGEPGFDTLTWLQPTSPLRTAHHIKEAFALFIQKEAHAVISVCACEHSPLWTGILAEDGNMQSFLENENLTRMSQQIPEYHRVNGGIYIARVSDFLQQRTFYIKSRATFAYKMSPASSVDIDDQFDFDFAEFLLSKDYQ